MAAIGFDFLQGGHKYHIFLIFDEQEELSKYIKMLKIQYYIYYITHMDTLTIDPLILLITEL